MEGTEVVLVHCSIVSYDYQHDLRVLYTFFPNISFGKLLDISPKKIKSLKTFHEECLYIELCFTYRNSRPLEIEEKININLVTNWSVKYGKRCPICFDLEILKGYEFLSFAKNMSTNIDKNITKNLSGKCRQELYDMIMPKDL